MIVFTESSSSIGSMLLYGNIDTNLSSLDLPNLADLSELSDSADLFSTIIRSIIELKARVLSSRVLKQETVIYIIKQNS